LLRQRQPPMQLGDRQAESRFGKTAGHPTDIRTAGQKHQYHLGITGHRTDFLHAMISPVLTRGRRPIHHIDWKTAPFTANHRRIQQGHQRSAIQRGGHDQQPEIRPECFTDFTDQRQSQIRIQGAFMELIKDHQ